MTRHRRLRRNRRSVPPRALAFATGAGVLLIWLVIQNRSAPELAACADRDHLTVAVGNDVAGGFRRDLVAEWNSIGTMKADLVEISDSTDEVRVEMAQAAQFQGCEYDIYLVDVAWTEEFAERGYISEIPLNDAERARFLDKALRTGQFASTPSRSPPTRPCCSGGRACLSRRTRTRSWRPPSDTGTRCSSTTTRVGASPCSRRCSPPAYGSRPGARSCLTSR
ncbi:hypothetical protein GCM10009556_083570 [Acrocarpospora pleiomorpha]